MHNSNYYSTSWPSKSTSVSWHCPLQPWVIPSKKQICIFCNVEGSTAYNKGSRDILQHSISSLNHINNADLKAGFSNTVTYLLPIFVPPSEELPLFHCNKEWQCYAWHCAKVLEVPKYIWHDLLSFIISKEQPKL